MNATERAEVYGLLAGLFYQPSEDGLAAVDTGAALRRLAEIARAQGLPAVAPGHLAMTAEAIRADTFRVFTHTISKECPPYETEYGEAHIFMQTQDLADLRGFYRAFGLEPGARSHERPDHLAFELEFLGHLAAMEAHHGDAEPGSVARDAAATFLRDHAARWIPAFCGRLRGRAAGGLFGDLAELLKAWIDLECRTLGVDTGSLRTLDLQPPTYHPDSSDCSTCGVGDIPETFFNQGAKP